MDVSYQLPAWGAALLIFALRIVDVSIGTLRIIMVVQGRVAISMIMGFFEVLIWIVASAVYSLYIHEVQRRHGER